MSDTISTLIAENQRLAQVAEAWKRKYFEDHGVLVEPITLIADLTERAERAEAALARAEQANAVLMDFAQASFAAEERYAMGKTLPPEWQQEWGTICGRTKALLLAAATTREAVGAEPQPGHRADCQFAPTEGEGR